MALLHAGVVLHLAIEHDRACPVSHRIDHSLSLCDIFRAWAEYLFGDRDLLGVKTPGSYAAQKVRVSELCLARNGVGDVAKGSVERQDAVGHAGVDHPSDRVVPQVLLVASAFGMNIDRAVIGDGWIPLHHVVGVTAPDSGGLHSSVGGQVRGAKGDPLHARRCSADVFDVRHTSSGLENRMKEKWASQSSLGFELRNQSVRVVDVFGSLDLGDHDDVEFVADLDDEVGEIIEDPRRVEAVDSGPQLSATEVCRLADLDQTGPGRILVVGTDGVFQVAEENVDLGGNVGHLRSHLFVGWIEEMDHPRRREGDLPQRLRGPDGQRFEKVLWVTHLLDGTEESPMSEIVGTTSLLLVDLALLAGRFSLGSLVSG